MGQIFTLLEGALRRRTGLLFGTAFSLSVGVLFYVATQSWIESDARHRFSNHALKAQSSLTARIKSYSDLVRAAGSMFHANTPVSRTVFHDFVSGLNLAEQYPAVEVINYAEHVLDKDRAQLEQRLRKEYADEIAKGLSVSIQPPGRRPIYQILTVAEPSALLSTVGLDLWLRTEVIPPFNRMIDSGKIAHSGQPIKAITGPNRTGLAMRLPIYRPNMPVNTVEERRAAFMGTIGIAISVHKLVKNILSEMRLKNVRMTVIDASPVEQARTLPALAGGRVLFDSRGTDKLPAPPLDSDPEKYFSETVTTEFHGRPWKIFFSTSKSDFYSGSEAYFPVLAMLAGMISAALLYALYHALSSSRQRAVSIAEEMTRELRDSEAQLKRSHDQLRRLAAHAEQIKEGERKRIAREIHDDLGQNLLALRIEADMLSSRTSDRHPHLHERANRTLLQIDATIKSVRQIINDLRPNVLDLGLSAAAEWQIAEFRRRTGIACELLASDNLEIIPVNDQCATAFFRILQESLNNIARHAQATSVSVELRLERPERYRVSMTVTDNGVGMPAGGPRAGSFGLVGIEERVKLLHGSFQIRSTPGTGTTLSVSAPLQTVPQRDAALADYSLPQALQVV
jgi:signal transduction histidine kinase